MKITGNEVRRQFIEFFEKKYQHTVVPSASLVPGGDQTLLFTNSGMVQFKDVFLGTDVREYSRAVNSQKCMRVAGKHNDLDDVGRDDSHHTFFEMLGNWSFGDYYKEEAITWAWELLTSRWALDKSKLWVTVFEDELNIIPWDEEAFFIWKEQPGIETSHILKFGRKDNLWEMAETGPCGPSSEIHMDFGPQACEKKGVAGHVCKVNGDCHRFVELWNLVFIQYNRIGRDEFLPLPKRHVDTGMGFERIVSVLQEVPSNYRTDLLMPLILRTQELCQATDKQRDANLTPYRVIADHARAASFLIADGVIPGNTGRNYVCRMIIRRAARFGSKLGLDRSFLAEIALKVIDGYSESYPELRKNQKMIISHIQKEEEQFHKTLQNADMRLEELIEGLKNTGSKVLDGESCFELYATHGLPLEITKDILSERGYQVSEQGFHVAMEKHKTKSAPVKNKQKKNETSAEKYRALFEKLTTSKALSPSGVINDPYTSLTVKGNVLAIIKDGMEENIAHAGSEVEILVPATPFYLESGGQVADQGLIEAEDGTWKIEIFDVFRPAPGIVMHKGKVANGIVKVADEAVVSVDKQRRDSIMRNHSATHLLHAALQKIIGDTVRQAGSLVAEDRLRFDFTHPAALSEEEIKRVEEEVNKAILSGMNRETREEDLKAATKAGAMALFGEKYGNIVRTVTFGTDRTFSYELCGGTHVENSSQIGLFMILSESSVAAGIRRIEAVTGWEAYKFAQKRIDLVSKIAQYLHVKIEDVYRAVIDLDDEGQKKEKEILNLQNSLIISSIASLFEKIIEIKGVDVLASMIKDVSPEKLRTISDQFRAKYPNGVAILGTVHQEKPFMVVSSSETAVQKGLDAKKLIDALAPIMDGRGGGNQHMAQAGGRNPEALPIVIDKSPKIISDLLG